MSWSDNNNNDPWGSSGNGSGRRGPGPNMDDVIRNAQNRFKGMMPGSFFGKLGPMVIIGILISALFYLKFIKSDTLINDNTTVISSEFSDDKSEVSIQNIDNS